MRPLLVSIEGINGVGKTYLTQHLLPLLPGPVMALDGFTERARSDKPDLGRAILRALITDSDADPFLRSGHPGAETLLLLAIKTYDWEEHCEPALHCGKIVIEGRSLHSIATYQALILDAHSDQGPLKEALELIDLARAWRPMPDLTLLVLDRVEAAIARLERREGRSCTADERHMHHRADRLYRALAAADPDHIRIVDLATLTTEQAVRRMQALIAERSTAGPPS